MRLIPTTEFSSSETKHCKIPPLKNHLFWIRLIQKDKASPRFHQNQCTKMCKSIEMQHGTCRSTLQASLKLPTFALGPERKNDTISIYFININNSFWKLSTYFSSSYFSIYTWFCECSTGKIANWCITKKLSSKAVQDSAVNMYADDTNLFYQSSDITQLNKTIHNDLSKLGMLLKLISCMFPPNKSIKWSKIKTRNLIQKFATKNLK